MQSLISKKRLTEERRTKQSLDSPQTIEANKKVLRKKEDETSIKSHLKKQQVREVIPYFVA